MLSGLGMLSEIKSVYDRIDSANDMKENLEIFREASTIFNASQFRKFYFVSSLIVLTLLFVMGMFLGSDTASNASDEASLAFAFVVFIPLLAIGFALPKIFSLFFLIPMLARMVHARLFVFWSIVSLPWVVLTGYWLQLVLATKVGGREGALSDQIVSVVKLTQQGIYVPYYVIAFIILFVFLAIYGRHDGFIWDENHFITRCARIGAGISGGLLSLLSYPLFFRRKDTIRLDDSVIVYDKTEEGIYHFLSSILQASPIDIQAVLLIILALSLGLVWYAQAD